MYHEAWTMTVSAAILPGLPGHGPTPVYFHARQPSPWREGLAVRLNVSGTDVVGNFQCGDRDYSIATAWAEANVVVCVARGILYLVPYQNMTDYRAYDGYFGAVAFSPSGAILYAVDADRVLALDVNLSVVWQHQQDLWRYGSYLILNSVNAGSILISAQFDLDGPWTEYLLAETDGTLIRVGPEA